MTNGDDAAFANARKDPWQQPILYGGLTKREYFAAMALQGIVAAVADNEEGYNFHAEARNAVHLAESLIVALNCRPDFTEGQRLHDAEGK